MKDDNKTKAELINELVIARQKINKLKYLRSSADRARPYG